MKIINNNNLCRYVLQLIDVISGVFPGSAMLSSFLFSLSFQDSISKEFQSA